MDVLTIAITAAITSLVSGLVGAVVATAIGWAKDKRRRESSSDKAMRDGMKLLLMDKVRFLTDAAIADGDITIQQRTFIKAMVDTAHDLGANGEMTACAEEVDKLPTRHD